MYVNPNYASLKLLKDAVKAGDEVTVFSPGPCLDATFRPVDDSVVPVEGPHYPEPHKWYAQVKVEGGRVVRVIS